MDKAKAAVNSFMSKAGSHDTTVHESVAPAIEKETVQEHRREEVQVAKDKEVHQDHYHTSVQPVQDRQVLPEQHHHKVVGVEHQTHDHRDHGHIKEKLQAEAAQFQSSSTRSGEVHQTRTAVPEVAGEHVHHHIHEKIQPVVHKETIEPHVVHTTVPIHETHHNAAQHHSATVLPPVNIKDFTGQGGSLTGRDTRTEHFQGDPKNIASGLSSQHNTSSLGSTGQHSTGLTGQHNTGLTGQHDSGLTGQRDSGLTGHNTGVTGQHNTGMTGHNTTGTHGTGAHHTSSHDSSTHKPSLMDKLNPKKDADGDGKAGFMS